MGVDVPSPGVVAILKEHVGWQKLQKRRGTPEYRKYRLGCKKNFYRIDYTIP